MSQNISLFDNGEEVKLDVVKMEYVESQNLSWRDLFTGYSKLYAITFSSGVGFVCELLELFDYSEIIFGSQDVMTFEMQEIMAFQQKTIERIRGVMSRRKVDMISKIKEDSLKLFVAKKQLSHEKIYLLEAEDGRKRTIFGSANMSKTAFSGKQRENICYIDGEEAFSWYMDSFLAFKEECTDNISESSLMLSNETDGIEEIPIIKTVKTNKVLLVETNPENIEDVRFALDVKKMSDKISPYIPKKEKNGHIMLTLDKAKIIKRGLLETKNKEDEARKVYPQLVIDVETKSATLNNKVLDLNPSKEEVKHDVDLFLQYMSGYERFHGDYLEMQSRYFEFSNWFFVSPFMAMLRDIALKYNHNLLPYPVFGLLYGQSKAGKTSFLETLLKMMIGQKTKMSAPDFTRSSIETLKREVMGVPIIVDDLTQSRFTQHAIETIKNDDFGNLDQLKHYPAIVISANEDVKAVAPEVTRRTIICRVQAGLKNTELMTDNTVRRVQKRITTALYREYLRRMLEEMPDIIDSLKDDDAEGAHDILATSSKNLLSIISEHSSGEVPSYIRELTLDNYFSEKVTGAHAMKMIQEAWFTNRSAFVVKRKTNQLCYNAGQTYEAERLLKELPEDLHAHRSRESIILKLDKACEFFEINFKKSSIIKKFYGG